MATATNTSLYKMNHTMSAEGEGPQSEQLSPTPQPTPAVICRELTGVMSLVKFYNDNFGMKLIHQLDFDEAKFSLYFLGFDSPGAESHGKSWTAREGLLELTHNYGTENDPAYKVSNGNSEPWRDMFHLLLYGGFRRAQLTFECGEVYALATFDHIEKACSNLEANGVKFHKKLSDGRQNNIAFALDPDNYWVEIIARTGSDPQATETSPDTYRFNHTMIRVKDPEVSLGFYRSVLGMSLLHSLEFPKDKFNLYFLGYRRPGEGGEGQGGATLEGNSIVNREGIVELTWNYGTEEDENFKYHNGNNEPQGFGHICVSVDDLDAACARFEDLKVNWKKRLTDGRMKNVAFLLDPDDYWVEVVQNEEIKSRVEW